MTCHVFRPQSPAAALGLAVSHLMTKPAFAALRFGSWSRVLAGQINRGHYWCVADDNRKMVGFLGWAIASEAAAEDWLSGKSSPEVGGPDADCIIINAWSGEGPQVRATILAAAREAAAPYRLIYFKRYYPNGQMRPSRLLVNDFVQSRVPNARRSDGLVKDVEQPDLS
jgi:hypothetical protein